MSRRAGGQDRAGARSWGAGFCRGGVRHFVRKLISEIGGVVGAGEIDQRHRCKAHDGFRSRLRIGRVLNHAAYVGGELRHFYAPETEGCLRRSISTKSRQPYLGNASRSRSQLRRGILRWRLHPYTVDGGTPKPIDSALTPCVSINSPKSIIASCIVRQPCHSPITNARGGTDMAHVKFQTRDQEIVWCAAFSRTPTLVWIKE